MIVGAFVAISVRILCRVIHTKCDHYGVFENAKVA